MAKGRKNEWENPEVPDLYIQVRFPHCPYGHPLPGNRSLGHKREKSGKQLKSWPIKGFQHEATDADLGSKDCGFDTISVLGRGLWLEQLSEVRWWPLEAIYFARKQAAPYEPKFIAPMSKKSGGIDTCPSIGGVW